MSRLGRVTPSAGRDVIDRKACFLSLLAQATVWLLELGVSQHFSTFYGSFVQTMDTQLNALPTLPVLARTVSGCLNSGFLGLFETSCGPSFQAMDTQLNALPTEPGGAHQLVLHPRKREHRVPEKTEDHDVSPDQKLRSGSQSRSSREILPPPRHDSGTGVVAGVEIPAGCPAVAAMVLD